MALIQFGVKQADGSIVWGEEQPCRVVVSAPAPPVVPVVDEVTEKEHYRHLDIGCRCEE